MQIALGSIKPHRACNMRRRRELIHRFLVSRSIIDERPKEAEALSSLKRRPKCVSENRKWHDHAIDLFSIDGEANLSAFTSPDLVRHFTSWNTLCLLKVKKQTKNVFLFASSTWNTRERTIRRNCNPTRLDDRKATDRPLADQFYSCSTRALSLARSSVFHFHCVNVTTQCPGGEEQSALLVWH